jgi:hypothetical protein
MEGSGRPKKLPFKIRTYYLQYEVPIFIIFKMKKFKNYLLVRKQKADQDHNPYRNQRGSETTVLWIRI